MISPALAQEKALFATAVMGAMLKSIIIDSTKAVIF